MTNQQKCNFSAVFASFLLAVCFFYLYVCAAENPEISGFCVSKSKVLRTVHKRSVVLLHRQSVSVNAKKLIGVYVYKSENKT